MMFMLIALLVSFDLLFSYFVHLVEDKPVPATAALDVIADLVEILCPLEIPVMTIYS